MNWRRQAERSGFLERAKANAVLALAFEHHLAIGKNVPLSQVVSWINYLSPYIYRAGELGDGLYVGTSADKTDHAKQDGP